MASNSIETAQDSRPLSPSNASNLSSSSSAWQSPDDEKSPLERCHVPRLEEKHEGYPRLAAFISSDPNFAMYRDPARLRSELILWHQWKISQLEARLKELDNEHAKIDHFILQSHDFDNTREDTQHKRGELYKEIGTELKIYDDLVLRQRAFWKLERPSARNYRNVLRYLDQERPIDAAEEESWLNPREMVSVAAGQDNSWLEGQIEELLFMMPTRWTQKVFTEPAMRVRQPDEVPIYYSKERIGLLSKAITIVLSLSIAMIPTSLLFTIRSSQTGKILIMLAAVISFSGALAACSRSRHQDIFMATAAFCAVLVAFLSQGSTTPQARNQIPNHS